MLEERGLVRTSEHDDDARVRMVSLTLEGSRRAGGALTRWEEIQAVVEERFGRDRLARCTTSSRRSATSSRRSAGAGRAAGRIPRRGCDTGAVPGLGAILTAIVTPFGEDGAVDEQAFVDLMHHLAANGSDGFVVCGTTGEAATLDDEEHLRVIELAVDEQAAPARRSSPASAPTTRATRST